MNFGKRKWEENEKADVCGSHLEESWGKQEGGRAGSIEKVDDDI